MLFFCLSVKKTDVINSYKKICHHCLKINRRKKWIVSCFSHINHNCDFWCPRNVSGSHALLNPFQALVGSDSNRHLWLLIHAAKSKVFFFLFWYRKCIFNWKIKLSTVVVTPDFNFDLSIICLQSLKLLFSLCVVLAQVPLSK